MRGIPEIRLAGGSVSRKFYQQQRKRVLYDGNIKDLNRKDAKVRKKRSGHCENMSGFLTTN
jgi:hypothetical protein